jgi:hypothetical protein
VGSVVGKKLFNNNYCHKSITYCNLVADRQASAHKSIGPVSASGCKALNGWWAQISISRPRLILDRQ